jgi:hypothetical protein
LGQKGDKYQGMMTAVMLHTATRGATVPAVAFLLFPRVGLARIWQRSRRGTAAMTASHIYPQHGSPRTRMVVAGRMKKVWRPSLRSSFFFQMEAEKYW